jgi:uncharacterized protein involved in exopolysaccharide biosynthesis
MHTAYQKLANACLGKVPMNDQQTPYPHYPPYIEDDEINPLDYLIVVLKHKRLIFGIVFTTGLMAVLVSLLLPNIYRSQATIIPRQEKNLSGSSPLSALKGLAGIAGDLMGIGSSGDVDKFEVVLKSRELTRRVVEKYNLMPELFEDEWDPLKNQWKENPAPTVQDAYELMVEDEDMLSVSRDRKTDVLTIMFDHEDPNFAKIMLDNYLTELSESLREETLKDAAENRRFLQDQLQHTPDPLLKVKISELLAKEIEKETFARAQKYYSFIVLDPPIVADPDKKEKPKRALICILSVTLAGFLAIFVAFFLEYVHRVKETENEAKLSTLRSYLGLRRPES